MGESRYCCQHYFPVGLWQKSFLSSDDPDLFLLAIYAMFLGEL